VIVFVDEKLFGIFVFDTVGLALKGRRLAIKVALDVA